MSDYSNIKLKVGNSTYSVGNSISVSSNSTVTVLNGSTTMATTTAPRSFTFVLYSTNFSGANYQVSFNANGGSGTMASQTGAEASNLTLNPCAFTRTGLTFAGWNTAADGSGDSYTNGETLTMWQNVTLYAQWISTETYTLTYDANGGVGTMESQSGTMLDSLIVAANGFTKDGYAFTGWNTAADGTGTAYAPTDGITLNANTTLYAQSHSAASYLSHLSAGDFTCGPVGVRMAIGNTRSGGRCSFAGQSLSVCIGDFHQSVVHPAHEYRADIFNDRGLVLSAPVLPGEDTWLSLKAENCAFYRAEVFDVTRGLRIAVGNPIWNLS